MLNFNPIPNYFRLIINFKFLFQSHLLNLLKELNLLNKALKTIVDPKFVKQAILL